MPRVSCDEQRCRFNEKGWCAAGTVLLVQYLGADESDDMACNTYEAREGECQQT